MVNLNTRTTLAQEFPKTTFDKRAYAGKVGMQVAATLPGAFKAGAIIGTIAQLNELQKTFGASTDKVGVAFEMLSTITMGGATLLAPGAAAIVTSGYRSFESLQALKEHLSQGEGKAVLLDLFRTGSNIVYIASIVSGNPVFMAVSLLAQGSEDIYEGATMLFEQLNNDEKDFVMVGAATLQMGLGALRGYQGASIGARYAMTHTQKPQVSRLAWDFDEGDFELTPEHLEKANACMEEGTITYVKLDDYDLKEVHFGDDANDCAKWHFINDTNLSVDFRWKVPDGGQSAKEHGLLVDWERPEAFAGSVKHLTTSVDQNYANAHIFIDDHRFIRDLKGSLDSGIKLATGNRYNLRYDADHQMDAAKESFKKFDELYAEFWREYKLALETAVGFRF